MTRRSLLKVLPSLGEAIADRTGRCVARSEALSNSRSLRSYARVCGSRAGVQANLRDLASVKLAGFIANNFDVLTPGNELKWEHIRRNPEVFAFRDADSIIAF